MPDIDLQRDWKKIVLIIVSAAVLAVLISIIAVFAGRSGQSEEPLSVQRPVFDVGEFTVKPETLMLPDIPVELWRGIYTPVREQKKQWDMEELRQYLYDPQELGAENLRGLNQEKIDRLLNRYR